MESTAVEESQVVFETLRDSEGGDFAITLTTSDDKFDEVQDALHTLVDDTIKGQIVQGKRIGIRRIVLCVVPDHD